MYSELFSPIKIGQNERPNRIFMAPMTRGRADEEGIPCYLEASNKTNVPFYERKGFKLMEEDGEVTLPDGPTFYRMWREPQKK